MRQSSSEIVPSTYSTELAGTRSPSGSLLHLEHGHSSTMMNRLPCEMSSASALGAIQTAARSAAEAVSQWCKNEQKFTHWLGVCNRTK